MRSDARLLPVNRVSADTHKKTRLIVHDREQALNLGEPQWATDTACVEFGDLLASEVTFDRPYSDITVFDEITLFDMTGLALQDLTVARLIFQKASATGSGTSVNWPW